jgi:multiple sugar transport system substrate-binding protein
MDSLRFRAAASTGALLLIIGCGGGARPTLTFSGSVVGEEAAVLRQQLARFREAHADIDLEIRPTPDAADERHQLYVQWLNGHAADPDVLQLDIVWTSEFAAAGWILPLERFHPKADQFFAAAVAADRWNGVTFALPWFVDVGMLYWRTDLLRGPPRSLEELTHAAIRARAEQRVPYGLVWTGARYEGLVTVFLEYLGAFGGEILDGTGRIAVDSESSVKALTEMRDAIYVERIVPSAALTWQEEQVRFAFQNGESLFMRNWPYAYASLEDATESRVAGKFGVAPMPAGPGGRPTATLGGSQLAINAFSDQPDAAYALIEYLLEPDQMIERASKVGELPSRPSLYETTALAGALKIPPGDARRIIEQAVARPATPVYAQLSEVLQVSLHRALTRQQEPRAALAEAARSMRAVLAQAGIGRGAS